MINARVGHKVAASPCCKTPLRGGYHPRDPRLAPPARAASPGGYRPSDPPQKSATGALEALSG
eukprot:3278852-Alexandrium_andersonii.AAC.1